MNKPGSHRGAPSVKKKKFSRALKKQPIPARDKIKEFVLHAISNAEEQSKKDGFVVSNFKYKDLTDKFKCKIGEVIKIVHELSREGLTSPEWRRKASFSIIYNNERGTEELKEIELYFNFESCPICEKKLFKEEYKMRRLIYDKEQNKHFTKNVITRIDLNCKNKCFLYASYHDTHDIRIFDNKYLIKNDDHNSIKNQKIKEIKKEIERLRKNERYVMKIFENNL